MIKKTLSFLLLSLLLITILLPISATADEVCTVGITCNASQSDAKGKKLLVYFKNIENEQVISKKISTNGINEFTDIPAGEYEFVKCVLYDNEDIEFKLASRKENLIVSGSEAVFYSFRVENNYTELKEGAAKEYKAQLNRDSLYVIFTLLIIVLFVFWCIFAIMGRKNHHKKMFAKLLIHLFLSMTGFFICFVATNANPTLFYIWLMGAGFPYGLFLVSYIGYASDVERGYYVIRTGENFGFYLIRIILAILLCAVVGIIALPIVIIKDIVAYFSKEK